MIERVDYSVALLHSWDIDECVFLYHLTEEESRAAFARGVAENVPRVRRYREHRVDHPNGNSTHWGDILDTWYSPDWLHEHPDIARLVTT